MFRLLSSVFNKQALVVAKTKKKFRDARAPAPHRKENLKNSTRMNLLLFAQVLLFVVGASECFLLLVLLALCVFWCRLFLVACLCERARARDFFAALCAFRCPLRERSTIVANVAAYDARCTRLARRFRRAPRKENQIHSVGNLSCARKRSSDLLRQLHGWPLASLKLINLFVLLLFAAVIPQTRSSSTTLATSRRRPSRSTSRQRCASTAQCTVKVAFASRCQATHNGCKCKPTPNNSLFAKP